MAAAGTAHPRYAPWPGNWALSTSTLRNWVYRAARQATPGHSSPPREEPRQAHPRLPGPGSIATPTAPSNRRRDPTARVALLGREYDRLAREIAVLKAALVLLARDLDTHE